MGYRQKRCPIFFWLCDHFATKKLHGSANKFAELLAAVCVRTDSRKIVNVAVRQLETGTRTFLPWDRSCPRLSPNTKGRGDYVEKTSHALFSFTAPLCFSRNGFKIAAYCFYRRAGTLSHARPGHIDSLPQVTAAIVLSSYAAWKGGHAPASAPFKKSPLGSGPLQKTTKKAVSLLQLTACFCCGAPEEIRTPGLQVRSLLLYPAELRARREKLCIAIALPCQILSAKK